MKIESAIYNFISRQDKEFLEILKNKKFKNLDIFLVGGAIRDILLNLPAEDFFKIYAERESYQEIPLLTSDGIVIPDIGLRESLQNRDLINNCLLYTSPSPRD